MQWIVVNPRAWVPCSVRVRNLDDALFCSRKPVCVLKWKHRIGTHTAQLKPHQRYWDTKAANQHLQHITVKTWTMPGPTGDDKIYELNYWNCPWKQSSLSDQGQYVVLAGGCEVLAFSAALQTEVNLNHRLHLPSHEIPVRVLLITAHATHWPQICNKKVLTARSS
jgi:hypothetical protein